MAQLFQMGYFVCIFCCSISIIFSILRLRVSSFFASRIAMTCSFLCENAMSLKNASQSLVLSCTTAKRIGR